MNRCKTCKWWSKDDDYVDDESYRCLNDKLDSDCRDGALSDSVIWTGPDFGCVHHEEKAAES